MHKPTAIALLPLLLCACQTTSGRRAVAPPVVSAQPVVAAPAPATRATFAEFVARYGAPVQKDPFVDGSFDAIFHYDEANSRGRLSLAFDRDGDCVAFSNSAVGPNAASVASSASQKYANRCSPSDSEANLMAIAAAKP